MSFCLCIYVCVFLHNSPKLNQYSRMKLDYGTHITYLSLTADCSHNHFSCIFCLCTIANAFKNAHTQRERERKKKKPDEETKNWQSTCTAGHWPVNNLRLYFTYIKQWTMLMNLLNRIPLDACNTHSKYQCIVRHGFLTLSLQEGE